jgi:hypothetical protein
MRSAYLLTLLAAAACGGAASTPTTPADHQGGVDAGPGALYAPLFVEGATWTFAQVEKVTPPIDMGPQTETDGPDITCTVTEVTTTAAFRTSKISCADGMGGFYSEAPVGLLIANAQGLTWVNSMTPEVEAMATAGTFDKMDLLIAPVPAARSEQDVMGDGEDGPREERHTYAEQKGDAWCVGGAWAAGDEAGFSFCMHPERGLVSVSSFQAGATTFETFLTAK